MVTLNNTQLHNNNEQPQPLNQIKGKHGHGTSVHGSVRHDILRKLISQDWFSQNIVCYGGYQRKWGGSFIVPVVLNTFRHVQWFYSLLYLLFDSLPPLLKWLPLLSITARFNLILLPHWPSTHLQGKQCAHKESEPQTLQHSPYTYTQHLSSLHQSHGVMEGRWLCLPIANLFVMTMFYHINVTLPWKSECINIDIECNVWMGGTR